MSLDYKFKAADSVKEGLTNWNLINEIRKWILTNEIPNIPDESVILFLVACDNDIENTKVAIERHFYWKKNAPELFSNRNIDSPEIIECLKTVSIGVIPNTTNRGHGVAFVRLDDSSFSKFDLVSHYKIALMVADLQLRENRPMSYEIVVDIENFSCTLLIKLKVGLVRKFLNYAQEGIACKLKGFHVLNCNAFYDKVMTLFKQYIKKELVDVIKTYPPKVDVQELVNNGIPLNCIPSDYGGTLECLAELNNQTISRLRDMKPFFDAEENLRQNYV